jgi:arginase
MQKENLSFYEHAPSQKTVSIISIPTELGSDARGLAAAPAHLYTHGLERMLEFVGVDLVDKLQIACPPPPLPGVGRLKNLEEVAAVAEQSAAAVAQMVGEGTVALTLGGDHSLSIGSIAGASRARGTLGVIWIDAHPDVNTDDTTISGNLHAMGASAAMGFGHARLVGDRTPVKPENFLFVGLKDFDKRELDFLHEQPVTAFTMLDIMERGFAPVFAAIDALSKRVDAVWVSMDIDSIDQTFAPGVAMPCVDGLTRREVLGLAQYIGHTVPLVGLDLVEMLPANDKDGMTAKLAIELTARFLGSEYTWYRDYMDNYAELNKVNAQA